MDLAELVGAWARGWSASRGTASPVSTADGLRIDLRQPGGSSRYAPLPTVDSNLVARLGRHCAAVGTEIKVLGDSTVLRACLGRCWRLYLPICAPTSMTSCVTVNACAQLSTSITGQEGRPRPPTEISRIRRLISQVEADLDQLAAAQRAQVEQAVATVRRHRSVALSMPRVRQPMPDVRPRRAE
jgi:hypothetical protein